MSTKPFPNASESDHPHSLWNEQEYIIRMLNQNAIGIGFDETGNEVTVSMMNNNSMNFIAYGSADFPSPQVSLKRSTDTTGWIYKAPDGSNFVFRSGLENRPVYDQYIHGWYHPREEMRAVMFIDGELPPGQRCIIMDSPNSMYEYDNRIPDDEYIDIVYNAAERGDISNVRTIKLTKGNYRFELRGGRGGNGGGTGDNSLLQGQASGGRGARGEKVIIKMRILEDVTINCYRGADGNDGDSGGGAHYTKTQTIEFGPHTSPLQLKNLICESLSGGGGASGEDTRIVLNNIAIMIARGGAGGGGATAIVKNVGTLGFIPDMTIYVSTSNLAYGPGGGGSGSGNAQQGNYPSNSPYIPTRAQPGNINTGGAGGKSSSYYYLHQYSEGGIAGKGSNSGQSGQNMNVIANQRAGGDAGTDGQIEVGPYATGSSLNAIITAKGGSGTKSDAQGNLISSGEMIIYRTRDG